MLARFVGLIRGFELLEGNIHDQDDHLRVELMASGMMFIQELTWDPMPTWGTLLEL
jgi:hypothetical protein